MATLFAATMGTAATSTGYGLITIPAAGAINWGAVGAAAAVTTAVAGTGLAAYSALQAGRAGAQDVYAQQQAVLGQQQAMMGQRQVAISQQAIADYNAKVAEQEARAIEQSTRYKQQRQVEAASRYGSSLLARLGAAGVVVSEGAPLMIQAQQAAEAELDNLMIGYEGQTAAARARSQARLDTMQGLVHRQQADIYGRQAGILGERVRAYDPRARAAFRAGRIGAGATLLTGFGALGTRALF